MIILVLLKFQTIGPFHCDFLLTKSLFYLTGCMDLQHGSVKRTVYRCLYCSKIFERQDHMVRHVRIHTGEKPWSCDSCGRRFNTKDGLKSHQLTHIKIS